MVEETALKLKMESQLLAVVVSTHIVSLFILFIYSIYMKAAAKALFDYDSQNQIPLLSAEDIAKRSMKIAADLCIYTNHNTVIETIPNRQKIT